MISKDEFRKLYDRLKRSELTESEFKSFLEYVNHSENHSAVVAILDHESVERYIKLKQENRKSIRRMTIIARAAMILLLTGLLAGLANYLLHSKPENIYMTSNEEIREIWLPDSSFVKLNANSSLEWKESDLQRRMVKLSGEAFFEVRHTRDDRRFVVETTHSKITVLGTSFNVNSRLATDKIFLEEGMISLEGYHTITDEQGQEPGLSAVRLNPGESAVVDPSVRRIDVSVNRQIEHEAAWKDGLLRFSDMKLSTIIERMEEIYGKDIRVKDPGVLDKEMEFTLPYANWEVTAPALALAIGLEIEETNGYIQLK